MATHHKKLLPQGTPPPQRPGPPPTGQRQVLRVNRACNSCRRQKMRCEGPDNPPCSRCRASGVQCVFSQVPKPDQVDAAATERIKELETQIDDIKGNQSQMQATLQDILAELRTGRHPTPTRYPILSEPSPPSHFSMGPSNSPTNFGRPRSSSFRYPLTSSIPSPSSSGGHSYSHSGGTPGNPFGPISTTPPGTAIGSGAILPPIQTITRSPRFHESPYPTPHTYSPPPRHTFSSMSSHSSSSHSFSHRITHNLPAPQPLPHLQVNVDPRRTSGVSSPANSDVDIPTAALVAPIEVIASLADSSEKEGPPKKRKRVDSVGPTSSPPTPRSTEQSSTTSKDATGSEGKQEQDKDVVEKGLISEEEARELFALYFTGCHRLLAVFDPKVDTFESMKQRSPFCFCSMLMVASKVRDGGDKPSPIQVMLQKEATDCAKETMFKSFSSLEEIQGMLLIAAWAHTTGGTGWGAAGHAIRTAVELGIHKALMRLKKKTKAGIVDPDSDRPLVTAARTWCALFVYEYQLSLGTGRPAMMGDVKGILDAREVLLRHPLSLPTDARLVSTCELLTRQSQIHEALGQSDEPLDDLRVCEVLREARLSINSWHTEWDTIMSHDHSSTGFFRASAAIQRSYAHLFYNSIAMRNLRSKADVRAISPEMKEVALTAIASARDCIDIILNNREYRDGLRFAVSYTHMCAAFAGAFLLRIARLFPDEADLNKTFALVEDLAKILSQVPASRFSESLNKMLSHAQNRRANPSSSSSSSQPPPFVPPTPPPPPPTFTNDFTQLLHPTPPATHSSSSAMDIFQPDQMLSINNPLYPGGNWAVPDYQMTGDLMAPMDIIHAEFSWDV